jgi:thiamine pyrophosphokinase
VSIFNRLKSDKKTIYGEIKLINNKALVIGGYALTNEEKSCIQDRYDLSEICSIAVDAGLMQFMTMDILPDFFIGDMDSVDEAAVSWYFKNSKKMILLKKDKDFLDMEAAVDHLAALSIKDADVWGVIGGRTDQTFSCIPFLNRAFQKGIELTLNTRDERIGILSGEMQREFQCGIGDMWSFIAISEDACDLTLKGFKYELENKKIKNTETIALSNCSVSKNVIVKLNEGTIMYFNKMGRHGKCGVIKVFQKRRSMN